MIRSLVIRWLRLDERYVTKPKQIYRSGPIDADPRYFNEMVASFERILASFDLDANEEERLTRLAKLRKLNRSIDTTEGIQGGGSLSPERKVKIEKPKRRGGEPEPA